MIEINKIFNIDLISPFDAVKTIMRQISSETPPIAKLSELYECEPEALAYILQRPKLAMFLVTEAYNNIRRFFKNEKLKLTLNEDIETGEKILFLYILTSLPVDEALAKLNQLDDEWWLDRIDDYPDLCIHVQMI
jgi:hypothetical protein